ncbi:hypothetical protein QAD02_008443 [Eretmocerus hayati]|uniref:Uncharacterized protein n=1 Tax=Eretmocerus hayati TaxID=131215 RepID=A0ACC2N7C0_9HYME|nr:hypothetical protein QAD02_008443 [Eretmocerus hayati]
MVANILQSSVINQMSTLNISSSDQYVSDQISTTPCEQHAGDDETCTNIISGNVPRILRCRMTKVEGSQYASDRSLLHDIQKMTGVVGLSPNSSVLRNGYAVGTFVPTTPMELTTADMCLSALYLHELHHRHVR